jgi:hypothetical protein
MDINKLIKSAISIINYGDRIEYIVPYKKQIYKIIKKDSEFKIEKM